MTNRRLSGAGMIVLLVCGCGSEPLASLTCRVTREGQPQPHAEVLISGSGDAPASILGVSMQDGTCVFDLGGRRGLPPGEYRITVTHYERADGGPVPGGEEGQALKAEGKLVKKQLLFLRTLAAGANSLDLKLEEGQEIVEEESTPEIDPL